MKPIQMNFTQNNYSQNNLKFNSNYQLNSSYIQKPEQLIYLMSLLENPQVFSGYINGYQQPVTRVKIKVLTFDIQKIQKLENAFNHYFSAYQIEFNLQSKRDLAEALGMVVCVLQNAAGLTITQKSKVDILSENEFALWIPYYHEHCFHQTLAFTLQLFNYVVTSPEIPNISFTNKINDLIKKNIFESPRNTNTPRLIQAAYKEGMPWCYLTKNIFQFGFGFRSRWLDSTFTDKSPQISSVLARYKNSTNILLKKAGFPTTKQILVHTESDAIEHAKKMGYPVVIKPENRDRGEGVCAQLISDDQVRKAFASAKKHSDSILLEKHIFGKDYRLLVLNGKLIWAIERVPASVKGDGVSTIETLIKKINEESNRHGDRSALKPIKITEDLIDFIKDQGYDLNSILEVDQVLQVCRIANISTGGMPVAVFEKVHPDNKRLAERAANLLRLDIVGIDFISPDIEKSYLEMETAIIEVNSQPQLGLITAGHIYHEILLTLLPNQGRIPIIVICSHSIEDLFIHKLHTLLSVHHNKIGIVRGNNAYLNDEIISSLSTSYAAGTSLLLNNEVEALIYCINSWEDVYAHGLPFDQYDVLFYLDVFPVNSDITKQLEKNLLHTIFFACRYISFINESTLNYLQPHACLNKTNITLNRNQLLHEMEHHLSNWIGFLREEINLAVDQ